MDRIQELLSRITELSDDELNELKDLVMNEIGGAPADGEDAAPADDVEFSKLEELAEATDAIKAEFARREDIKAKRDAYSAKIAEFRSGAAKKPEAEVAPEEKKTDELAVEEKAPEPTPEKNDDTPEAEAVAAGAGEGEAKVPEDRKPKRQVAKTTVIRAGADLPGIALGAELTSPMDVARAMHRRIETMRGIRGGDGDKLIVATASLDNVPEAFQLKENDPEGNTLKVEAATSREALVAAGGLGAPEEVRYDLFDMVGDTDRPVKQALPGFTSQRGGVRFMRAPTLADVNGVVGIWTVADDIDALTDDQVRKPSFRVTPGPEIVVNTQAITMIMTFGNLMSRAYPELIKRHQELALVAWTRVAEQQLLTQIGALSTKVTTATQKVSAARDIMNNVSRAVAAYRNRNRMKNTPLKAFMPLWFKDLLRADIVLQHPGDGLEIFDIADAQIERWFSSRNVNVVWTLDGEAGQDYSSLTSGTSPNYDLADYPAEVIWYLFAEGTFAHMDGGTLDLGLVRDSTLNAANDYQTFVESFENVVKFGNDSLRIKSSLRPTGQGAEDKDPALIIDPTPTQPT